MNDIVALSDPLALTHLRAVSEALNRHGFKVTDQRELLAISAHLAAQVLNATQPSTDPQNSLAMLIKAVQGARVIEQRKASAAPVFRRPGADPRALMEKLAAMKAIRPAGPPVSKPSFTMPQRGLPPPRSR